jgi:hypothetical protein
VQPADLVGNRGWSSASLDFNEPRTSTEARDSVVDARGTRAGRYIKEPRRSQTSREWLIPQGESRYSEGVEQYHLSGKSLSQRKLGEVHHGIPSAFPQRS